LFPLIEVSGAPRERGRAYGRLASARIERSIATYSGLFAYCGIEWGAAQLRAAAYRESIGQLDAELLEEIAGIAEGSGRHVNEILALNARTEILPPSYLAPRNPDLGECTALAVPPALSETGGTLLAQNWDWVGAQRQALVLLRIRETDGSACLTLTEAGMLAKIGLNQHGFGLCLNILRSSDDGGRPGVPVHALLRALLKCGDVGKAQAFAAGFSYGASSNVLCADAGGSAANLELSPQGLQVLRDDGAVLCHTNHFLRAPSGRGAAALPPGLSSEPRLARAQSLAAAQRTLGVAGLTRILRDESAGLLSICRRPDPELAAPVRLESVASVIMELQQRRMHVAPEVPSLAEYHAIALQESMPA
jgi:isopenicillin-N N-acyltransferase-like protein